MKNTRLKRMRHLPFGATIIFIAAVYSFTMLLWPLQSVNATTTATPDVNTGPAPDISWPAYGQSAIGTATHGVLATHGAQTPVPMASITKIVTALVVLENKPLTAGQAGPMITFTAEDAARYNQYFIAGGSIARADAGMQLSQYQVLQGMLIRSANNYADALAIWAYGSMDSYLAAAKSYLAKHNLTQTIVADASGFSPESKSSASDLVLLGKLALDQSIVASVVSQKTATIPGVGELLSTNLLLGNEGVVGIKTGTTDEAGSCLVFAAKYVIGDTPVTVIGATLGGPNHVTLARDVTNILASAKSGFQQVTLAKANKAFATYKTPWGASANAITNKDTSVVAWPGSTITQQVTTTPIKPENTLQSIGTVTFTAGDQKYEVELSLDKPLEKPNLFWRLTHPQEILKS